VSEQIREGEKDVVGLWSDVDLRGTFQLHLTVSVSHFRYALPPLLAYLGLMIAAKFASLRRILELALLRRGDIRLPSNSLCLVESVSCSYLFSSIHCVETLSSLSSSLSLSSSSSSSSSSSLFMPLIHYLFMCGGWRSLGVSRQYISVWTPICRNYSVTERELFFPAPAGNRALCCVQPTIA